MRNSYPGPDVVKPFDSYSTFTNASAADAPEPSPGDSPLLSWNRSIGEVDDVSGTGRAAARAATARPGEGPFNTRESAAAGASILSGTSVGRDGCTSELTHALHQLTRLVANVTESYTSAIFLSNQNDQAEGPAVTLTAIHTLSRDIVPGVRIAMGAGLVGWTAENRVRISVCPFEHDATTLLYYSSDQALKSFIALPVLSPSGELLGVLACDSKKSYAFAKVTEKVLIDCADQAAALILLHRQLSRYDRSYRVSGNSELMSGFLEHLRGQRSEQDLLLQAAEVPPAVVERDALVVITVADGVSPPSAFYSSTNQVRVGHRLLELVCRHKRVLCADRSVQTTGSSAGITDRSFLSIPFHIRKREAGSINLLSRATETFTTAEIAALEGVAKVVGKELELFRLRSRLTTPESVSGLMSWDQFSSAAKVMLEHSAEHKHACALIRLVPENLGELEDFLGVAGTRKALEKLSRLVEQVNGSAGVAGMLYGHEIFVLSERKEGERILGRLQRLLERFSLDDGPAAVGTAAPVSSLGSRNSAVKISNLINRGLAKVIVSTPKDGDTLDELVAKSNRLLESAQESAPNQMVANVSHW